jgi:hypothetical protein
MPSRRALPFVALFAAASVVGCGGGEGVKSYTAKRDTVATMKENTGPYRLLGVMVPADDPIWFFKLSGGTDDLTKHEAGFDELVKSIRYKGENAVPEFVVPKDWTRGPGRGTLVKAIVKPPDPKLEVTVVASAGGVDGNLKRWVEMLGNPSRPGDEARYTKSIDAAGGPVRRVDIRGSKNPNPPGGPMMGKAR